MSEYTEEANQMLDEKFGATVSDTDYRPVTDSDSDSEDYPSYRTWDDLPPILTAITVLDDKKKFLSFMEDEYPLAEMEEQDARKFPRYCNVNYFMKICEFVAVSCAAALLEGEVSVTANPNELFQSGMYPLHYAAAQFSYAMVDLLLKHGARTDVETMQVEGSCRGGLLPLNVALESLRTHRYLLHWNWKPYPPFLKMICIFCLPQMKAPLEVCRLLASNMADADVDKVFHSYCMHGDYIEIVALLMVSRKKLIDTSSGSILVCKSIVREIEQLTNEEITLLLNSKSVMLLRKKITHLKETLFLLRIFEKIGDAFDAYVKTIAIHTSKQKVVDDIKMLLAVGGVSMKHRDTNLSDIDCESEIIKLATEILEKMLQSPSQGHSSVAFEPYFRGLARWLLTDSKKQSWAMRGFFSMHNPVFKDGDNRWRREEIIPYSYRPSHRDLPYFCENYRAMHDSPGPVGKMVHHSVRGYSTLARAVKKLPRYI